VTAPLTEETMLDALWERHEAKPFPDDCRGRAIEGVDLEQLDADVGHCVREYLSSHTLAPGERALLVRCIGSLEQVVPRLEGDDREYFRLLEALTGILLHHCQADAPAA
jgi:hypothetical protein